MNILYFAIESNLSSSGVTQKIKDQACALGSFSDSTTLLLVNARHGLHRFRYSKKNNDLELIETVPPLPAGNDGISSLYQIYKYYSTNLPYFLDKICEEESITSLYCRKLPMYPNLISALQTAKNKHSFDVCCEIPTYPYLYEFLKEFRIIHLLLEFLFSRSMYRIIDHFFLITDKINEKRVPFKRWTRITNGISVDRIPTRSSYPSLANGLNLLGLANASFWHGYDRVIRGIHDYNKSSVAGTPVSFHVVGLGPATPSLKELARDLGVEEQVIFHGPRFGAELDDIFSRCQIGVGSLGAHRKRLFETSELKTREYCARGLPFFIGSKDPDFPAELDFIHYVTSDDSPVDIESILDFARSLEPDKSVAERMREYARMNLDWKKIMAKVYQTFELLAEKKAATKKKPERSEA